ncbi:MAG: UDP-glucose 4-epimerase GalE [bacterium]|nr:UDP-glucose 4-epimerase GalE [bacterium]
MNILVTGGLGYIGSHTVVELIKKGYSPVILDNLVNSQIEVLEKIESLANTKISFHNVDCRDTKTVTSILTNNNIEAVIHFAALKSVGESVAKPMEYFDNNVNGLISLLKAMELGNTEKIIFSSSCTVYGEPNYLPVDENHEFKPASSPYGRSKQICEYILQDGNKTKTVSLRYFNPIGAHQSGKIGELPNGVPNNLVPFITQTGIGIREKLVVHGADYNTPDGSCIRDFIHVVDLAQAHVAALEYLNEHQEKSFETFNVGTGNGNSVLELLETFEDVNNIKLNYEIGDRRSGDIVKIYADATKAKDILDWSAKLDIRQSLKDSWNWETQLAKKRK